MTWLEALHKMEKCTYIKFLISVKFISWIEQFKPSGKYFQTVPTEMSFLHEVTQI